MTMNSELTNAIQEALKITEWPHGDSQPHHGIVDRHPVFKRAIMAIAQDSGCTIQQVHWRAFRLYMQTYLNTRRK